MLEAIEEILVKNLQLVQDEIEIWYDLQIEATIVHFKFYFSKFFVN